MNDQHAASPAENEFQRAAEALRREEILKELRQRTGLSYASIGPERLGPFLVAFDGEVIGEVRSDQGTVLHGWHAVLYDGEGEFEPSGPFLTIRSAAASMIR